VLIEAVLSYCQDQRPRKLEAFTYEDVDNELADVIITTLVVAVAMKKDTNMAIVEKLKKIEAREEV